jgi:hypothetical protein
LTPTTRTRTTSNRATLAWPAAGGGLGDGEERVVGRQ